MRKYQKRALNEKKIIFNNPWQLNKRKTEMKTVEKL